MKLNVAEIQYLRGLVFSDLEEMKNLKVADEQKDLCKRTLEKLNELEDDIINQ